MKRATIILIMCLLIGAFSQVVYAGLGDIGPVRLLNDVAPVGAPPERIPNGFPIWYQGINGVILKPSFVGTGLSGPDLFLPPDPAHPNPAPLQLVPFGLEAFIWSSTAVMTPGKDPGVPVGTKARCVLDLEMSYANGLRVLNGDQYLFGRVRIDVDFTGVVPLPPAGFYTVTFPYGTKVYALPDAKLGMAIKDTFDWGGITPNFSPRIIQNVIDPFFPFQNLTPIGRPFLTQVGAPVGRLGDGVTPAAITGSPFNTNFFQITGPADAFGVGVNTLVQNLWVTSGKLFDGYPFKVLRSTYSSAVGGGFVADILAVVPIAVTKAATLSLAGLGGADVPLVPDTKGSYTVHAPFAGPVPAFVTIKDTSPAGVAAFNTLLVALTDVVTVTQATFSAGVLTVTATSSDANITTLKVAGGGIAANTTIPVGVATAIPITGAAPPTITVSSTAKGIDTVQVLIAP